jgi:hypothetical protein
MPGAPRYLEPVYLLPGAAGPPSTFDVMLGRFPAGSYSVRANAPDGPLVAQSVVGPPLRNRPGGPAEPSVNYTDLWWNPSQSGWGMSIFQGPTNEVFAIWFAYDASGNPVWYTLQPGSWDSRIVFSGPIYRTTGPYVAGPFDPAAVRAVQVGTGDLEFLDATHAMLIYTIDGQHGVKSMQREPVE